MNIVFFHTKTCPQCRMVEIMLADNHIQYESCTDIAEMTERGITHTPALMVDGQILQGKLIFDWIKGA